MKLINVLAPAALIVASCGVPNPELALSDDAESSAKTTCSVGLLDDVTDDDATSKMEYLVKTTIDQASKTIIQQSHIQEILSNGQREVYESHKTKITVDLQTNLGDIVSMNDEDSYAGQAKFSGGEPWNWDKVEISLKNKRNYKLSSVSEKTDEKTFKLHQILKNRRGNISMIIDGSLKKVDCDAQYAKRLKVLTGS
jgi:hypothetical protein